MPSRFDFFLESVGPILPVQPFPRVCHLAVEPHGK